MDYNNYSVEDFVLDKRFKNWLIKPKKENNLFWEEWIKNHPDQLPIIEEAKKVVLNLPLEEHRISESEKSNLWNGILNDIKEEGLDPTKEKRGNVIPLHSESIIGKAQQNKTKEGTGIIKIAIAASLILLLGLSLFFSQRNLNRDNSNSFSEASYMIKSNTWGQKSTVFLSDGTEIILNSGSSLSYLKDFESDQRVVELQGEAFFNVTKDANRPFRVISKNIITEALGTSFNIRAFENENDTRIALVTGKVLVKNSTDENSESDNVLLTPGEMVNYSEESNHLSKTTFNIREICSWKDRVIYFSDAKSKEVFTYLEQWYGVRIVENNAPMEKWNYTGEFTNLDLNNVLNSIGFTMNFEYEKNDKTYFITYQKPERNE